MTGFGCYNGAEVDCTGEDKDYAETWLDDNMDDGSFEYWELQCDLDFPTEAYVAGSGAMKSVAVAMASLIAFSAALF